MKKTFMVITTLVLVISMCIPAIAANISSTSVFTNEFIAASDDTIVCYMYGCPVRKDQINENGMVKPDAIEGIEKSLSTRAGIFYDVLPDGHKNAAVGTYLSAPRYGQSNTLYYFSEESAERFASSITYNTWQNTVIWLAGFIPKVGPVITLTMGFDSLRKSEMAERIINLTNNHCRVNINEASSSFGTFYGVFEWDTGRTFKTADVYSPTSGTKEEVTNIQTRPD